jgi:hypothetical protein
MKLHIDLETLTLIVGTNDRRRIARLEVKRGDSVPFELRFLRDGQPVRLAASTDLRFSVKEAGAYDSDPVVFFDGFTQSAIETPDDDPHWTGRPNFNTEELNSLFSIDGDPTNDPDAVDLMAEFSWLAGGDPGPSSTLTFSLRVANDVHRDEDGTPLALPSPEDWLAARNLRWYPDIVYLDTGAADSLDALPTVDLDVGTIIQMFALGFGIVYYRLDAGFYGSTSTPDQVLPLDADVVTNAKTWTRIQPLRTYTASDAIGSGIAPAEPEIRNLSGSTYTVIAGDLGKILVFADTCTVTIPTSFAAGAAGFNFAIIPEGGDVTVSTADTLNGVVGGSATLAQGPAISRLIAVDTNDYVLHADQSEAKTWAGNNPNIPEQIVLSGISDPELGSLQLNFFGYQDGKPVYTASDSYSWEVTSSLGFWYIEADGGSAYGASLESSAESPVGLTGWTITNGEGQPVITGDTPVGDYLGQLLRASDGTWWRWAGSEWEQDLTVETYIGPAVLASAVAIGWDVDATGRVAKIDTLGHNATVNLAGLGDGEEAVIYVTQDATGGRSLTVAQSGLTVRGSTTAIADLTADEFAVVTLGRSGSNLFVNVNTSFNE